MSNVRLVQCCNLSRESSLHTLLLSVSTVAAYTTTATGFLLVVLVQTVHQKLTVLHRAPRIQRQHYAGNVQLRRATIHDVLGGCRSPGVPAGGHSI